MPRILINATPCAVGGAVQVALGLIREAVAGAASRGWTLTLAVSQPLATALGDLPARCDIPMEVFQAGPGSIISGHKTRQRLKALSRECNADVVFTVFGPSYVRFPVPEMMGFADGFAITPMSGCYANHDWRALPVAWLKANAKRLFLHTAERFWVETETAKVGLCRRAWVSPARVDVVSNGVNAAFAAALFGADSAPSGDLLLLGAAYPHKNHAIILPTACALSRLLPDHPWRFVVTLPEDSSTWINLRHAMNAAGLSERIINRGVLNLAQCAQAYESATVVFHPSLLEIFSAGYVEAMAAKRPIVASDRAFAHEICGDAAAYFDPLDGQAAAQALARLLGDAEFRQKLVLAGEVRLNSFPDAARKNGRLCDLIDCFVSRHLGSAAISNERARRTR